MYWSKDTNIQDEKKTRNVFVLFDVTIILFLILFGFQSVKNTIIQYTFSTGIRYLENTRKRRKVVTT